MLGGSRRRSTAEVRAAIRLGGRRMGNWTSHRTEHRMTSTAPLANTITLGVQDFQRELDFYRDLGWPLVFESDDFVAFELQGALLTLFPVEKLAADSRARPEVGQGGIRFSV